MQCQDLAILPVSRPPGPPVVVLPECGSEVMATRRGDRRRNRGPGTQPPVQQSGLREKANKATGSSRKTNKATGSSSIGDGQPRRAPSDSARKTHGALRGRMRVPQRTKNVQERRSVSPRKGSPQDNPQVPQEPHKNSEAIKEEERQPRRRQVPAHRRPPRDPGAP